MGQKLTAPFALKEENHGLDLGKNAFSVADDPDLGWIRANPDRALVYFFVHPHPCSGVDELFHLYNPQSFAQSAELR